MEQTLYPSLTERLVLITGGASGIGADMVRTFADQGCRCVFIDIQDKLGNALADELGENVHFFPCDLTDTKALQSTVLTIVEQHGAVSVLINNAADDDRRLVSDVDESYWTWSQSINVQAQFFMAQAVLPSMKSLQHGAIINLSSISWRIGVPELAVYATAKAGILGLTNTLASAFGEHNIRVNAIEPGAVMTEKQRKLWYPNDQAVQEMLDRQKLARPISGVDIANVALFLASDESSAITGQSLRVDAGFQ